MSVNKYKKLLLALLLVSSVGSCGFIDIDNNSDIHANKNHSASIESSEGIIYNITINQQSLNVSIEAHNPTEDNVSSWLNIEADGRFIRNSGFNISAGERRSLIFSLNSSIDLTENTHPIEISTFGNETVFEIDLGSNSPSSNGIPLPEIENVEVTRATIDDQETTALRVIVRNEARVQYVPRVRVSTLETNSNAYTARVPLDENRRTIVVPLNEDPEMVVAGEVRLYTGWVHNESRISDQVEFEGTVDGGTEVWDREFEPIQVDYANRDVDEYRYRNASVEAKNDAIWRERLKPVAAVAGVLLVGILLAVALLSRRR